MESSKIDIATLIRHVQGLVRENSPEAMQELEFYEEILKIFTNAFTPGNVANVFEICLKVCPIPKAEALAKPLGMWIVEGESNSLYLSLYNPIWYPNPAFT